MLNLKNPLPTSSIFHVSIISFLTAVTGMGIPPTSEAANASGANVRGWSTISISGSLTTVWASISSIFGAVGVNGDGSADCPGTFKWMHVEFIVCKVMHIKKSSTQILASFIMR